MPLSAVCPNLSLANAEGRFLYMLSALRCFCARGERLKLAPPCFSCLRLHKKAYFCLYNLACRYFQQIPVKETLSAVVGLTGPCLSQQFEGKNQFMHRNSDCRYAEYHIIVIHMIYLLKSYAGPNSEVSEVL